MVSTPGASDGYKLAAEAMILAAINVAIVYKESVFILESFWDMCILYSFRKCDAMGGRVWITRWVSI
jgi:hypothetical protein